MNEIKTHIDHSNKPTKYTVEFTTTDYNNYLLIQSVCRSVLDYSTREKQGYTNECKENINYHKCMNEQQQNSDKLVEELMEVLKNE